MCNLTHRIGRKSKATIRNNEDQIPSNSIPRTNNLIHYKMSQKNTTHLLDFAAFYRSKFEPNCCSKCQIFPSPPTIQRPPSIRHQRVITY